VRSLAATLRVSAGTVATAYASLRDRGVVETAGRRGTVIRAAWSRTSRTIALPDAGPGVVDLSSGSPDPRLLPDLEPHLRMLDPTPVLYEQAGVLPELDTLARDRLSSDGVPVTTAPLALTGGALDGIERCLTATLHAGDLVAVEDPGWSRVLDLVPTLGMRVVPMAVDASGPVPSALDRALRAGVRAVILTSRAHNPTGGGVSEARAAELRELLMGRPPAVVIEDDHAAELSARPLASVAGPGIPWVVLRSVSKPFGPDLRLAVLAGAEVVVDPVIRRQRLGAGWVSHLLQRLVVSLWTDPRTDGVIERARQEYSTRRTLLVDMLGAAGVPALGDDGVNVWIPVRDETSVVASLLADGWLVAPGAWYRVATAPGIRISIGALDPAGTPELSAAVARAVHPGQPRPRG
jgi:DNA-binding transcriptional MocR family regulator